MSTQLSWQEVDTIQEGIEMISNEKKKKIQRKIMSFFILTMKKNSPSDITKSITELVVCKRLALWRSFRQLNGDDQIA